MTQTMRAATVRRYGGPEAIRIEPLPRPEPGPGEVRVRVHASVVTAADVRMRSAEAPRGFGLFLRLAFGLRGLRQPIPGAGFSGVVDAVAPDVKGLAVGEAVFGTSGFGCRAHAEFLTVAASAAVLPLPGSLSFDEGAAFCFGGLTAADFLIDKAQMQRGESLAVIGATGSVGSAALSLAQHLGLHVTALASAENHDLARALGASQVLDYRSQQLGDSSTASST